MVPAITAITMPIIAYISAFLADSIFPGLPAEVRYIMPATIIIITDIEPTMPATVVKMLSKRAGISGALSGFEISTADAKTEIAKPSKTTENIKKIKNLFII